MSNDNVTVNFVPSTEDIIAQQNIQAATSIIDFQSAGHCLIIGDVDTALKLVPQLGDLKCTVVNVDKNITALEKRLTESGVAVFTVPHLSLQGYLGSYDAQVEQEGLAATNLAVSVYAESGKFDSVLDLNDTPILQAALPPLGYFRGHTEVALTDAVAALPELVGDFEKPKYFEYNASICAHSRSELDGCNACMSACATGAITSAGEGVEIDPYLCQGCGSCATVCPSGAMTYAYPKPENAIERTREMLREGAQNILLLHAEDQQDLVDEQVKAPNVLPLLVEEVSAFGMDYWASMVNAGVQSIVLLVDDNFLEQTQLAVQSQIDVFQQLLNGLGITDTIVRFIGSDELNSVGSIEASPELAVLTPSSFVTHNNKRQTIRSAMDVLSEQLKPVDTCMPMQAPSPFGVIEVDQDKCTLCMACVSVCPGKALLDGQDTPALRMIEANCLQCGLCESACPETAISLKPQYTFDSIEARKIKTLNEEAPFNCIRCQKPFATAKIIQTMFDKLSGHWMFEGDDAKRRLKMCEDCRVKDMFEKDSSGIDVHKPENG